MSELSFGSQNRNAYQRPMHIPPCPQCGTQVDAIVTEFKKQPYKPISYGPRSPDKPSAYTFTPCGHKLKGRYGYRLEFLYLFGIRFGEAWQFTWDEEEMKEWGFD